METYNLSRWYDVFIKPFSFFYKILKNKRLKNLLLERKWELSEHSFLFNYLYDFFDEKETVPTGCGFTTIKVYFDLTIWHNKPCMGEQGPNPGAGAPIYLAALKGDEYLTLEVHKHKYSALKPSKVCTLYLRQGEFKLYIHPDSPDFLGFCFSYHSYGEINSHGNVTLIFNHKNTSSGELIINYPTYQR